MSHRYYVVVGLDVPGHFKTGASPEEEGQHAAQLVRALLQGALADRDISAEVTGAITLSPDMIDDITASLHDAEQKREADWTAHKKVIDQKLAELRAAIDRRIAAQKKDVPR